MCVCVCVCVCARDEKAIYAPLNLSVAPVYFVIVNVVNNCEVLMSCYAKWRFTNVGYYYYIIISKHVKSSKER